MEPDLLTTKLHAPALHPQRIRRERLIRRLDDGLRRGCRVTLVSAPAGFGKTTCVREWLAEGDVPYAWLCLDAADNDPARFFQYFLQALQQLSPELGEELAGAFRSGMLPPPSQILTVLVNDSAALDGPRLLVLDDFHLIQDAGILQLMEGFVANLPEKIQLVLITREDPPLPLARLRASALLNEIRTGDLRFTTDEMVTYFSQALDLTLDDSQVGVLEDRTEGWAAGLQLAVISLRDRRGADGFFDALGGSHRHVLGYLSEEVMAHLPSDVQNFLICTSVADRLCGALCDALTDGTDGTDMLERLYAANLFIVPMDDEGRWYRYHHLFGDILRSLLKRSQDHAWEPLNRKAAAWFEAHAMPTEAIHHFLEAQDFHAVMRLIEEHVIEIIMLGQVKTVENWLDDIPAEYSTRNPHTLLAFGWMYLLRGSYDTAAEFMERTEAALIDTSSGVENEDRRRLHAEWLAFQSNFLNIQGRAELSLTMAEEALRHCAPQEAYLRSLIYLGMGGAYRLMGDNDRLEEAYRSAIRFSRASASSLPEMLALSALSFSAFLRGKLHMLVDLGLQALERQKRAAVPPPISATVYGMIGMAYYEWNRLEEARAYYGRARRLSEMGGHNAGVVFTCYNLARLESAEGDDNAAKKSLHEADALIPSGIPAWLRAEIQARRARLLLENGELDAAEDVLGAMNETHTPQRALAEARLLLARVRISREYIKPAREKADLLVAEAERHQLIGVLIPALLVRAQILRLGAEPLIWKDDLRRALTLGEKEGYLRTFLDEGAQLTSLLGEFEKQEPSTYLRRVMDAAPPEQRSIPHVPDPGLPSPLTERELEVLHSMADGLKYEEIAERLFITVNTVRFYVKEIYRKLGVNNRTKAVASAQQNGWI